MAKRVTTEERERIVAAFAEGKPCNQIAREFGRSQATISSIAAKSGHDFERSATKKAAATRSEYTQADRLTLINAGLDKAYEILNTIEKASQFRDWSVGLGVVLDKRRQEEATDYGSSALDMIFQQIDQQADDYEATLEPETGVRDQPE